MSQNTGPTPVMGIRRVDVLDDSDRLPDPLLKIRDSMVISITSALGKMFDGIDDSFFELADGACTNSEQSMYFDSMREVRIKRLGVEKTYKHEIHKKFRDLLDPNKAHIQIEADSTITSDEMSIVQDDIMEESVAITSMVSKARSNLVADLHNIHQRVDSLFNYTVTEKNNPLDPQQLCDIFAEASELFDLDIRAKILVYKQFDRHVMSQLPVIIKAANKVLIEAGVLPRLKIKARRSRSLPPRRPAKSTQPFTDSGDMLEQGNDYADYSESGGGAAPGSVGEAVFPGVAPAAPSSGVDSTGNRSAYVMNPSSGVSPSQNRSGYGAQWNGRQAAAPLHHSQSSSADGEANSGSTGSISNQSGESYTSPHAGVKGGVFHLLQDMMSETPQYGKAPIASSSAGSGRANVVPRQTLLGMLTQLQYDQKGDSVADESRDMQLNIREALQQILSEQTPEGERAVIGRIDEDTINLVSMFFDFILDDHNLPTSIQALIGRLQIPVLKVAIKDKAFFNKGSHPARKLLNELARAGLGLDESSKESHDVVYERIAQVVHRILAEFDGETALFSELYNDFSDFILTERKRSALVEQRTREIAQGQARTERARQLVVKMIQDRIVGQDLPKFVATLLQNTWSKLLFRIGVKQGPESEDWYRAVDTVDQLIWSLTPRSDKSSRQRWVRMLPIMLKSLRQGLQEVSFSSFDTQKFFTELESLHIEMLERSQSEVEVGSTLRYQENITHNDDRKVVDDNVKTGTVIVSAAKVEITEDISELILNETAHARGTGIEQSHKNKSQLTAVEQQQEKELAASYVYMNKIDVIEVGTWMEFTPLSEPRKRCKLAAKLRENDHLIYVNRRGMKVMDWSRSHVAAEMRKGRVKIIDNRPLFDRALDTIVGALGTKPKTVVDNPVPV